MHTLLISLFIPLNAIVKLNSGPAEAIERAAYREIHLAFAQPLDGFQVLEMTPAARIGDRDRTPLC